MMTDRIDQSNGLQQKSTTTAAYYEPNAYADLVTVAAAAAAVASASDQKSPNGTGITALSRDLENLNVISKSELEKFIVTSFGPDPPKPPRPNSNSNKPPQTNTVTLATNSLTQSKQRQQQQQQQPTSVATISK
jgi:hypothetical protein